MLKFARRPGGGEGGGQTWAQEKMWVGGQSVGTPCSAAMGITIVAMTRPLAKEKGEGKSFESSK